METVVQEIANQLGMAVDQAGQFIMEQLPGYAALKAMQFLVPMLILLGLIIFLAILSKLADCKANKLKELSESENKNDWPDSDRIETWEWVQDITFIAATILVIVLFVCCLFTIPLFIGWLNYPEGMLIDLAIQAVS